MRPALQLLICPLTELYVIVFRSFENVTSCERVVWMHTTRKQYWRWVEDFHTDAKRTIRTEQIKLVIIIIIIIIYPLTARVVGAPHMILHQFPPFFPVLHCPLGLGEIQACPFRDVVFPFLPLSALPPSPFHCALQDGFGQT